MVHARNKDQLNFNLKVTKSGCTTSPTRRSETARLHKKTVDGKRSEGVLSMAANTKAFAVVAVSISGALRTQLMMTMVSG